MKVELCHIDTCDIEYYPERKHHKKEAHSTLRLAIFMNYRHFNRHLISVINQDGKMAKKEWDKNKHAFIKNCLRTQLKKIAPIF